MHGISFQAKRVHLSAVAFGRRLLADVGEAFDRLGRPVQLITPARFDILYAIYIAGGDSSYWRFSASRAHLSKTLGLHPSTISKTIKRLIALKILRERKSQTSDLRLRFVTFTQSGLELFRRALQIAFGRQRPLTTLLTDHVWRTKPPRSRRRWRIHAALFALYSTISALAYRLGDCSTGIYHPRRNGTKDRQSPESAELRRDLKRIDHLYKYNGFLPPPRRPSTAPLSEATLPS